jgi:hypothetical protein
MGRQYIWAYTRKTFGIASGATPIGSTGHASDDNGGRWVTSKSIIDYFVDNNLRLYCRQIDIDYSHRELFAIIWKKSNTKILHISTVKQGLQGKLMILGLSHRDKAWMPWSKKIMKVRPQDLSCVA